MFEHRLQFLIGAFALALLLILGRLVQLQVVYGDYYQKKTEDSLLLQPEMLPFVRGSILDRHGTPLVYDAPSWDVCIDYDVLALSADDPAPRFIEQKLRQVKRFSRYQNLESEAQRKDLFLADVSRMWQELATLESSIHEPTTPQDLLARATEIRDRIQRVREVVKERRGFEADVAEERIAHPVVRGLSQPQQVIATELFVADQRYPWLHIQPAQRRTFAANDEPFAHILGRLGRVDADDVAHDPNRHDPLARYRGDELIGKAGVELAAERYLRGQRGLWRRTRAGEEEVQPAVNGQDVRLTIDAKLQRELYDLLQRELPSFHKELPGASIVVVDIPTREIRALVSYPSYDPRRFRADYDQLRDETVGLPLRFRPLQSRQAPGSIIKPLVCLAALNSGTIDLNTHLTCNGYLFANDHSHWRCWEIGGTGQRKQHGSIDVVSALRGSCNIFMYKIGEKMGLDVIWSAFDMVGLGHTTGTGLYEESRGLNPTAAYLVDVLGRHVGPGKARHFAIGQGEVAITPVQAANLVASYADGRYQPLTLMNLPDENRPSWELPFKPAHQAAIRKAMYQVVNHPAGTAKAARLGSRRFAICGKTGTATTLARPTMYRVKYEEGGKWVEQDVPEVAAISAINRVKREHPDARIDRESVHAIRWVPSMPDEETRHKHKLANAWFIGFLQPLHSDGTPDWSRRATIGFAVLIEFGGSGGRVAGPIARRVAETAIDILAPDDQP